MSERTPRDRMVDAATLSLRTHGVSGTSLRDVVAAADAPRGSLQHYFPDGKDQLVREALGRAAVFAARIVERAASGAQRPSDVLAGIVGWWQADLRRSGYEQGCPLLAVATDVAGTDSPLHEAIAEGFETWLVPVRGALRDLGVDAARARSLATLMISSLEGAITLARAQRRPGPLTTVVRELGPVLDAATTIHA